MAKTRLTRQREVILSVLKGSGCALNAEQICEKARETLPTLALTTVYRNLDRLLQAHLVTAAVLPEGGAARYLPAGEHRHHLVCMGCDRTIDLPDCPLEAVEAELEEKTGFTIARHELELYGYCPQCLRGKKRQEGEDPHP